MKGSGLEVTMAKAAASTKLDTRTKRSKVKGGEYTQEPLTDMPGCYLAYRKGARGAGAWRAKWVELPGKKRQIGASLGKADDISPANGTTILSYSQAIAKAMAWCSRAAGHDPDEGPMLDVGSYTVADALREYFADKEATGRRAKGIKIYRQVADAWIVPELGVIPVAKLKLKKLNEWRDWFIKQPRRGNGIKAKEPKTANEVRARKSSCNRVITILRAALAFAVENNDDLARECFPYQWRNFKGFDKADGQRDGTLATDDRQKMIEACDADFALLVKSALLTGCRHGELRLAQAKDYRHTPKGNGYLLIPADNAKSGKERRVKLTKAGTHFFDMQTTGKAPDDLIFTRGNGVAWLAGSQRKPMQRACVAAGIAPLVFHELRHTRATMLENAGLDYMLIQLQMGHAIGGITETYLHRDPDHASELLEHAIGADDWTIVGRPEAAIAPLRAKRRA